MQRILKLWNPCSYSWSVECWVPTVWGETRDQPDKTWFSFLTCTPSHLNLRKFILSWKAMTFLGTGGNNWRIPAYWQNTSFFSHFCVVVQLQLSPFFPHKSPTPTIPTSHPDPIPLWFCPCVLYRCSWEPFSLSFPLSPLTSPLVTVSLFLIPLSLVIFCLLVCFVD